MFNPHDAWVGVAMLAVVVCLMMDVPPPSGEVVEALNLAGLSARDSERMNGRTVRAAVTVASLLDVDGDFTTIEVEGPDEESRTVVFAGRVDADEMPIGTRLVVEGQLRTIRHRPVVHDGQAVVGFIEVRLVGARRIP